VATTGHARETRSATRWIRKASASIKPSGSGREVTTTNINAPMHSAASNDATKYPTGSAALVNAPGNGLPALP
jgi:hypothetical protein